MLLKNTCFYPFGDDDNISLIQGVQIGVTHQIENKFVPHIKGILCMAHHTNLIMQIMLLNI
jgi:hypothetical protein